MDMWKITLIEIFAGILIMFGLFYEDKIISFERTVASFFKELFSIAKATRAKKMSVREFCKICRICAIMELEEKHSWCGKRERKLIKDISLNVLCILIAIIISTFIIKRWG